MGTSPPGSTKTRNSDRRAASVRTSVTAGGVMCNDDDKPRRWGEKSNVEKVPAVRPAGQMRRLGPGFGSRGGARALLCTRGREEDGQLAMLGSRRTPGNNNWLEASAYPPKPWTKQQRRGCGLKQSIGHPLGRNNHAQSRLFRPSRTWRNGGYCREAPGRLGWVTAHRDIGQKSAVRQPNEALMPNPDHQQGGLTQRRP